MIRKTDEEMRALYQQVAASCLSGHAVGLPRVAMDADEAAAVLDGLLDVALSIVSEFVPPEQVATYTALLAYDLHKGARLEIPQLLGRVEAIHTGEEA